MTRILHVLSSLKKNGTETFIMNVLRKIDKDSFKFDFLVFNDDRDGYYEEILSYGSDIFFLPPRRKGFIDYHKKLNAFFRDKAKEYDVVHLHDMSLSSLAPLYYAKKYGVEKRIIHIHGSNCKGIHNQIFHRINKFRLRSIATHFLSCSNDASNWGYKNSGVISKSKVIANGIDLSKFVYNEQQRNKIRKELGIGEQDFTIIHVGSFNAIKNQSFLLDVVKSLITENNSKNYKLLCVGAGELLKKTKEYAKEIGISENVYFLGHRDDIGDLMSASDLLIFPSLHEGLGLVVVEAQASGLPVVVSTGIPQEVGLCDNFCRLDLKKGSQIWASEIIKLMSQITPRQQSIKISPYSIKNTVTQLANIYE